MELVKPNVKGMPYDPVDAVRIVDPNQYKLYLKHGLEPYDVYYSHGVVVMVFDKDESYPFYQMYNDRTLE